MDQLDNILAKLDQIERMYGLGGGLLAIFLVLCFIVLYRYLIKSVEKTADSAFNRRLEQFKNGLYEKLGSERLKQQGQISKEITAYKSELDKDLSKLSADLQVSIAKKVENENEERRSIIEYLDRYSAWLYECIAIQVLDYKYQNFQDITTKLDQINEAYTKTNIAQNKLRFWTRSDELIKKSLELNQKIFDLSQHIQKTLSSLRHNLSWGKIYSDSFQQIIPKIESHKDWAEFLASEDKRIKNENDILHKEFWNGRLELYKDVLKVNIEFQDMSKVYLNKITRE